MTSGKLTRGQRTATNELRQEAWGCATRCHSSSQGTLCSSRPRQNEHEDKEGTVVAADPEHRTYLVTSPAGVLLRNRKHVQQLSMPRQVIVQEHSPGLCDSKDIRDSKDVEDSKDMEDSRDFRCSKGVASSPRSRAVSRASRSFVAQKAPRFREQEVWAVMPGQKSHAL